MKTLRTAAMAAALAAVLAACGNQPAQTTPEEAPAAEQGAAQPEGAAQAPAGDATDGQTIETRVGEVVTLQLSSRQGEPGWVSTRTGETVVQMKALNPQSGPEGWDVLSVSYDVVSAGATDIEWVRRSGPNMTDPVIERRVLHVVVR